MRRDDENSGGIGLSVFSLLLSLFSLVVAVYVYRAKTSKEGVLEVRQGIDRPVLSGTQAGTR